MRNYRRLAMLAILVACLLMPSIAQAEEPFFNARSIRRGVGTEVYSEPAVSGDWVVYCMQSVTVPLNVYAVNLRTGVGGDMLTPFALHGQTQSQSSPDISGTKVVWQDRRYGGWDVHSYDLVTNQETTVAVVSAPSFPAISGNRVVYQDNTPNVHVYDLTTKQDTVIGPGRYARIWGDWVVYETSAATTQIRAYNASTATSQAVTAAPAGRNQELPDIWGSMVVWQGWDGVQYQIYWTDISWALGPQTVNGTGPDPRRPTISNNRIYFKADLGSDGIWMYDIGSQAATPFQLSSNMAGIDRFEDARPDGDAVAYRLGDEIMLGRVNAPTVNIDQPSGSVPYNSRPTLTGSIWDFGIPIGNIQVSGDRVKSQLSGDGWSWTTSLPSYTTDPNGKYSIQGPPITSKTYFRVKYLGQWNAFTWASHLGATSEIRTVWPRVALGKPTLPSRVKRKKAFTAWNYIQPKQTAGSKPVKIEYWRKTKGHYRLHHTALATTSDYSATKSKYAAKTSLPHSGKWRMRAVYPSSATNAYTTTAWVYRTVR